MRIVSRAKTTRSMRGAATAVALMAALVVSGCAEIQHATDGIQPPPVNPSSPIAAYADQVSKESFPAPKFSDVPPKPTDVRSPGAYKTAIMGEVAMRRELSAWRAAHPDLQSDTEAWADLQKHRIPSATATPVATTHDAEAEAFARRLREEATKSPQ